MTTDTARSQAKLLAREIVADLFTDGQGCLANRLELKDGNNHERGGWSFEPALDRVTKILQAGLGELE